MTKTLPCIECLQLLLLLIRRVGNSSCVHLTWDDDEKSRHRLIRALQQLVVMPSLKHLTDKGEVVNLLPWQPPEKHIVLQRYQYPAICLLILRYLYLILIYNACKTQRLRVVKNDCVAALYYRTVGGVVGEVARDEGWCACLERWGSPGELKTGLFLLLLLLLWRLLPLPLTNRVYRIDSPYRPSLNKQQLPIYLI